MTHIKLSLFILVSLILIGCNTDNNNQNDSAIKLKASGLSSSVTLFESISNTTHTINRDGNYDIPLPTTQKIYDLSIINSNQQTCELTPELDLKCMLSTCTAEYKPVCAKNPFVDMACINSGCAGDQYLTFGNICLSQPENALVAFQSECGGLEDAFALHNKPAYMTNLSLFDYSPDSFEIVQSNIIDDTLTIQFEVLGGCGSHDFTFVTNDTFMESEPNQLSSLVTYQNNDLCSEVINIERKFDLLPIKEIYNRTYPQATGVNTVILTDFGSYSFILD